MIISHIQDSQQPLPGLRITGVAGAAFKISHVTAACHAFVHQDTVSSAVDDQLIFFETHSGVDFRACQGTAQRSGCFFGFPYIQCPGSFQMNRGAVFHANHTESGILDLVGLRIPGAESVAFCGLGRCPSL